MAAKIRRDDEVIVLTGKDKGKRGKVKNVLSSGKVIVEGINLVQQSEKTDTNKELLGQYVDRAGSSMAIRIGI